MKLLSEDARRQPLPQSLTDQPCAGAESSRRISPDPPQPVPPSRGRLQLGRATAPLPECWCPSGLRPGFCEVAHARLARAVKTHLRSACGSATRSVQDDRTAFAHLRQAFWTGKIVPLMVVSRVSSQCSTVILPSASWLPPPKLASTMSRDPRSDFTAS